MSRHLRVDTKAPDIAMSGARRLHADWLAGDARFLNPLDSCLGPIAHSEHPGRDGQKISYPHTPSPDPQPPPGGSQ
ncbi:hypothetical protein BaRGS_00029086 [Batillaria attramentaria]|uniref:Uncharacterized protein n=1 Tax=Batillaria attramentaria TaxID=370345 RepID=A0ABD0JYP1_9CAEN